MEGLVKAINQLTQAVNAPMSMGQWILVIVPIILSVIAIWISIATSKKQNKIALFEKRYKMYLKIKEVKNFGEVIKKSGIIEQNKFPQDDKNFAGLYISLWIAHKKHYDISFHEINVAIGNISGELVIKDESKLSECDTYSVFRNALTKDQQYLEESVFLLSEDISEHINKLSQSYIKLVDRLIEFYSCSKCEDTLFRRNNFYQTLEQLEENKILHKIEKQLKLK